MWHKGQIDPFSAVGEGGEIADKYHIPAILQDLATLSFQGHIIFSNLSAMDVSGLAGSNDRQAVSKFIVDHFSTHNIHAVQFIGTVAKITFAVKASKQQVMSHQSVSSNGVQCAVRGRSPRSKCVGL